MAENYDPLEESYARSFYALLGKSVVVSKLLGGVPPHLITGNKVFFDYQKVESTLSFHKFDGRCIKLELRMESMNGGDEEGKEDKKPEPFRHYPCLDKEGLAGKISEGLFKEIISNFYIPNLRYFHDLHKPKQ